PRDRPGSESGGHEVFERKTGRLALRLKARDAVFHDVEPYRIAAGEPPMALGQLPAPIELAGEGRARIVLPRGEEPLRAPDEIQDFPALRLQREPRELLLEAAGPRAYGGGGRLAVRFERCRRD